MHIRGHESKSPLMKGTGVSWELQIAIDKHAEIIEGQLSKYRLDLCKRWLVRARDLEQFETHNNEDRSPHVSAVTEWKRLPLTKEILMELEYDDMEVLSLQEVGATLVRLNGRRSFRLS